MDYAVVTPVKNGNRHYARSPVLETQALPPSLWVVVDTGSTDETIAVAEDLASMRPWMRVERVPVAGAPARGATIVRAFHAGLKAIPSRCRFVVKLDADITMEPDHFARLLTAFHADAGLGIASGTAYELDEDGVWHQRHGTGPGVWGAARMYRRACLEDVLPLEERMGWDTIDLITALVKGWQTRVLLDVPFFHHRSEGERDASRLTHWVNQGRVAHYLGYRPTYLVLRAAYRAVRDPAAVGVVAGYVDALRTRSARCADETVRDYVREHQRLRYLGHRRQEATRPRASLGTGSGSDGGKVQA